MDDQILKALNHIKYVSKKRTLPSQNFYFLQKNGALNYDYDSLVKKSGDFRQ